MILTAAIEMSQPALGRLRPLDPIHDLRQVADLIAKAFAGEMDERGRAALRELRWMGHLSPLVWWLSQVDPEFNEAFRGFVWEVATGRGEGRRLVGNVNLNRAPGNRQRYIVCNVVVAEGYRGQGIGRQLTQAAVAEAEDLGAQGVLLQVYRDNHPALHLYTALGFEEAGGEVEMRLAAVEPVALLDAPDYKVRAWNAGDGSRIYDLARRAIPTALQWIRPLRLEDYRRNAVDHLVDRLGDLLAGRKTYRLLALKGADPVAAVTLTADFRGRDHTLSLLVSSAHAGQVEAALISRALYMLAALPRRPVKATLYAKDATSLRVLEGYGFQKQRTLLTMRRDFR